MAVKIYIPTALRVFTDRQSEISAEGATVGEAINSFADTYPAIRKHLYQDDGQVPPELRSFINIFIGDTNIKNLQGLSTKLTGNESIMIVPAIAGGRRG
ncbi:MAG: MoaD/ThiS family protein [Spirochaetaceae bacterium]|jgi:adenylyltransferase/sulfurtransferase|nr:MoaD/ThiS family protein [Spirochaetaceae bacterium]